MVLVLDGMLEFVTVFFPSLFVKSLRPGLSVLLMGGTMEGLLLTAGTSMASLVLVEGLVVLSFLLLLSSFVVGGMTIGNRGVLEFFGCGQSHGES